MIFEDLLGKTFLDDWFMTQWRMSWEPEFNDEYTPREIDDFSSLIISSITGKIVCSVDAFLERVERVRRTEKCRQCPSETIPCSHYRFREERKVKHGVYFTKGSKDLFVIVGKRIHYIAKRDLDGGVSVTIKDNFYVRNTFKVCPIDSRMKHDKEASLGHLKSLIADITDYKLTEEKLRVAAGVNNVQLYNIFMSELRPELQNRYLKDPINWNFVPGG